MKRKLLLLLIIILICAGFVAFRFIVLRQQTGTGKLRVISSPDASVFLNNVAIGKTAFEDKVKEGEYLLKLIPEGTATDTASWQGKIKIYKNSLTYVDRDLGNSDITSAGIVMTTTESKSNLKGNDYGEIEVETEPAGAIVYLDNDEKGIAPLLLSDVLKGEHELSVYSPSFFKRTQKINVEGRFKITAEFKLAIDPTQKKVDFSPKVTPSSTPSASLTPSTKKVMIQVLDTPTGFLRVREEPNITSSEEARLNPNDKFPLIDEQPNWYKIEYDKGKQGWVAIQYAKKIEE